MAAQINLRVLKAAARFACKDEVRDYMAGVYVECAATYTRYTAMDGHRAICYQHPATNDVTGAWIIPTKACTVWKLKKPSRFTRLNETMAALDVEADNRLRIEDFESGDVRSIAPVDGNFPPYARIIPSAVSGEPGQYCLKLLADFQLFADDLELGTAVVCHNGTENITPIKFTGDCEAYGVIMPMRKSSPDWQVPAFFR